MGYREYGKKKVRNKVEKGIKKGCKKNKFLKTMFVLGLIIWVTFPLLASSLPSPDLKALIVTGQNTHD